MVKCSAPGKLILFGEHAVVFGEPALATAINLRTNVSGRIASEYSVNSEPLEGKGYSYVRKAVGMAWEGGPLELKIDSTLPPASGMGSSAAVTVATLGLLSALQRNFSREWIARKAFEVEYEVQGRASPIDTTTSCHGAAVFLSKQRDEGFLWRIRKGESMWYLHARDIPRMKIVVGDTRVRARTGPLIEGVRKLVRNSTSARRRVREIGKIAVEGLKALRDEDFERVGELMGRNHKLLCGLGVGHKLLDRYIEAALPLSYGAKLTGAGGGGSMIALTDSPEEVSERIKALGGRAFIVETENRGVLMNED
ncbi:MAG: mevalonate kinase [Thermoplasmata archaeon]